MMPPFIPPNSNVPVSGFNQPSSRGPQIQLFNMLSRRQDSDLTLVWVGKIAVGISDDSLRSILSQCGEVLNWRRVTDTKTGQPKSFGFCDFRFPEGAIIAIQLLSGLLLGDSELSLRVDEKTQKKLNDTKSKVHASSQQTLEKDSILSKDDQDIIKKRINDIVAPINKIYQNAFEDPDNIEDESLAKELRMIKARKEREEEEKKKKEDEKRRDFEYKRQRIEEEKERQKRKEIEDEKTYRRKERELEDDQMARERELDRRERDEARKVELRNKYMEEDDIDDKYRRRKIRATRRDRMWERDQDIDDEEREQEEAREKLRRIEEDRMRLEYEERKKQEEEARMKKIQEGKDTPAKHQEPMEVEKEKEQEPLKIQIEPIAKPIKVKQKPLVPNVFKSEAEEEEEIHQKKKKLFEPLLLGKQEEEKKAVQIKVAQQILEKIPSDKETLFAMEINWELVKEKDIINNRLRPYIEKKIIEYLGETDEDIIEFICEQIEGKVDPNELIEQLKSVIEEEAEVFISRLWRLLIYEMMLEKANE